MNICNILSFDFFTAGGLNSPAQITSLIANGLIDADSAAQEAIEEWELDHAEQGELSHMVQNGYTREDLVGAMQRFIDQRPDIY